jgi:hypothetical protein
MGVERARHGAALTRWPGSTVRPDSVLNRKSISNGFKFALNFDRLKRCLSLLQKFQIKYVWKELEIRNNFSYRYFSRLEIELELKFRKLL